MGNAGGFKMQVEDRTGTATPQQLQAAADDRRQRRPACADTSQTVFSTFRADVPQLYADVDRGKAKTAEHSVTDVFQTLQVYLGSLYINDFNYLGRTYHVIAQADAPFRDRADDITQLKTRNRRGRDGAAGLRR